MNAVQKDWRWRPLNNQNEKRATMMMNMKIRDPNVDVEIRKETKNRDGRKGNFYESVIFCTVQNGLNSISIKLIVWR